MSRGANVYGYVYAESGMGELTRSVVASLQEVGAGFSVVPVTTTQSRQDYDFSNLGEDSPVFDVNIVGVNADMMPIFVRDVGYSALRNHYTICVWAWEVEIFPEWMARSADFADEIWGISAFTSDAIRRTTDKPVETFPLPVSARETDAQSRDSLGLPEGFIFYFTFDFDSVFERKNPLAVVRAFTEAFPHAGEASLVIKSINGARHPEKRRLLFDAAGLRGDIHVIDRYVSKEERWAMMASIDGFVSLHRSEGFGLTMAEAMAMGKPVIATGYSGNLDFMTERNSFLVPYDLVRVGSGCGPYPESARWADPDLAVAAEMMRMVFSGSDEVQTRSSLAKQDIKRRHGPAARAQFVVDRLDRARDRLKRRARRLGEGTGGVTVEERSESADSLSLNESLNELERLILAGPDVSSASSIPFVVPWLRRLVMRLTRNSFLYQQDINSRLMRLVGSIAAAPQSGPGNPSRELVNQLDAASEIAEHAAADAERQFGADSSEIARVLRLLAARLRGLGR